METEIVDFSRASLTFSHVIRLYDTERVVAEGWVRLVCVDERFKPKRLPEEVVQIVTKIV